MKVRQAVLQSGDLWTIAWVNASKATRKGVRIRGSEDGRWWVVMRLYLQTVELSSVHRDWKVGGLV